MAIDPNQLPVVAGASVASTAVVGLLWKVYDKLRAEQVASEGRTNARIDALSKVVGSQRQALSAGVSGIDSGIDKYLGDQKPARDHFSLVRDGMVKALGDSSA